MITFYDPPNTFIGVHRGGGRERYGAVAGAGVVLGHRGGARAGRHIGRNYSLHRLR